MIRMSIKTKIMLIITIGVILAAINIFIITNIQNSNNYGDFLPRFSTKLNGENININKSEWFSLYRFITSISIIVIMVVGVAFNLFVFIGTKKILLFESLILILISIITNIFITYYNYIENSKSIILTNVNIYLYIIIIHIIYLYLVLMPLNWYLSNVEIKKGIKFKEESGAEHA